MNRDAVARLSSTKASDGQGGARGVLNALVRSPSSEALGLALEAMVCSTIPAPPARSSLIATKGRQAASEDTKAKAQRWLESQLTMSLREVTTETLRASRAEGEQLSEEQLSHAREQLSGERARRGEASAAAKAQLEAAAAQLAEAETEASTAAQAKKQT